MTSSCLRIARCTKVKKEQKVIILIEVAWHNAFTRQCTGSVTIYSMAKLNFAPKNILLWVKTKMQWIYIRYCTFLRIVAPGEIDTSIFYNLHVTHSNVSNQIVVEMCKIVLFLKIGKCKFVKKIIHWVPTAPQKIQI